MQIERDTPTPAAPQKLWLCASGMPPFELMRGHDVTIGRGADCDLSLYSSLLSREHACVRWENGIPVLFDLESLNGTFVGPVQVHRHRLRHGDVIRLGDMPILFALAEVPPPAPDPNAAQPLTVLDQQQEDPELAPAHETRLYSRTQVLHQRLFDYDELSWLEEQIAPYRSMVDDLLAQEDLGPWFRAHGEPEDAFWALMRLGVLHPKNPSHSFSALPIDQTLRACQLSRRGAKLRIRLTGKRASWNEIAAVRYQTRQGPLFPALRQAARAYRPGGGLLELDLARFLYEAENIYSPELPAPVREQELRRLQSLGVLAPIEGAGREAWYPADYPGGLVNFSNRGRAMMEGFRLEE